MQQKGSQNVLVQAPGGDVFLKGLAVVDNIAYIGVSPLAERSMRADPGLDCQLAAFHLIEERLLWIRKVLPQLTRHSIQVFTTLANGNFA